MTGLIRERGKFRPAIFVADYGNGCGDHTEQWTMKMLRVETIGLAFNFEQYSRSVSSAWMADLQGRLIEAIVRGYDDHPIIWSA